MNYSLAKELKDARFPMIERADKAPQDREFVQALGGKNRLDICYVPTLSELIAACGDGFWSMGRTPKGKWFACGTHQDEEIEESTAHLTTPEEVVARLWLALNKKS